MKKNVTAFLCAAVIVISGCSSGNAGRSDINVVDAGGHSIVDTPSASDSTVGADNPSVSSNPAEYPETDISGSSYPESVMVNTVKPSEPEEDTEGRGDIVSQTSPDDDRSGSEASKAPDGSGKPAAESSAAANGSAPPAPESDTAVSSVKKTETEASAATASKAASTPATSPADKPTDILLPNAGANDFKTLNFLEVKGIWISYIELSEMLTGRSESEFRSNIGAAYDNIAELGLNTVYVHVRSHGDAYYRSELFPPSKYASGTLGKAPDFDPLEVMLEEAHERGLSFQAWINPLRCCSAGELSALSGYRINDFADGKRAAAVNGVYYLNPAYDEVIGYIAEGAAEIVANYDVDGLHIDDYFYPTTDASFDSAAYSESGFDTISAFRLANCDKLVSGIYGAVKAANKNALFSVSCQGSVENNYNQMYADVKKWCSQAGYMDYVVPQIYYGFDNSAQPYEKCASQWDEMARAGGMPLVVGLSASKVGLEDAWAGAGRTEWITDENILARQIRYALELRSYGGVCLYSYRSVFEPEAGVKDRVEDEIAAVRGCWEIG